MPPPLPRHFSPSDKDKKHRPFAPSPFPRRRVSLPVAVSLLCSLVAVTAVAFATSVLLRPPRVVSVFRCGLAVDKFRTFQSRAAALGGGEEREIALRPKLLGVVGVQTRFESADLREALRSTWFPPDPDALVNLDHATGLAFRFVIGRTKNKTKMAELHEEEEKYHDFIFIDIDEEHAKLPYKTLEFFKAAYSLFEADFYVKADDNIYLRPDRLATLLAKERTHSLTYIGCMKKGPVITDPNLKWYESQGHLIGNEYFQHAYGPIYALSAEVVSALASAKNDSLRMFSNEDITIGSWMLAMNVHHEDNKAICEPQCSPRSIAVWDVPKCSGLCDPIKKLRALHNNTMCTKSPTVPLEDED